MNGQPMRSNDDPALEHEAHYVILLAERKQKLAICQQHEATYALGEPVFVRLFYFDCYRYQSARRLSRWKLRGWSQKLLIWKILIQHKLFVIIWMTKLVTANIPFKQTDHNMECSSFCTLAVFCNTWKKCTRAICSLFITITLRLFEWETWMAHLHSFALFRIWMMLLI